MPVAAAAHTIIVKLPETLVLVVLVVAVTVLREVGLTVPMVKLTRAAVAVASREMLRAVLAVRAWSLSAINIKQEEARNGTLRRN